MDILQNLVWLICIKAIFYVKMGHFWLPIISVRWPILSADNIGSFPRYYRPIYRYRSYTKLNWRRPLNLIYNSKIVSILIPQFATSNITSYFATLYIDIRTNENKHTWSRLNWAKKWNTNRYMWLFTFTILVIFSTGFLHYLSISNSGNGILYNVIWNTHDTCLRHFFHTYLGA